MWFSKTVITLGLLASFFVSANPTSLNKRSNKNPIQVAEPDYDIICGQKRVYTRFELKDAATYACTRTREKSLTHRWISWYYFRKLFPSFSPVYPYAGVNFSDNGRGRMLLRVPLPKRNPFERARWQAIVAWDNRLQKCELLGAEYRPPRQKNNLKCSVYNKLSGTQKIFHPGRQYWFWQRSSRVHSTGTNKGQQHH